MCVRLVVVCRRVHLTVARLVEVGHLESLQVYGLHAG